MPKRKRQKQTSRLIRMRHNPMNTTIKTTSKRKRQKQKKIFLKKLTTTRKTRRAQNTSLKSLFLEELTTLQRTRKMGPMGLNCPPLCRM